MEEKNFGILIKNVIGYTSVEILIEDQSVTQYQQRLVTKGTLVTALSHGEAKITANEFDPPHNYKCVMDHETVTLHCKPTQVYQLTKSERSLLNGVPRETDRIEVLYNLDWVSKLHFGSFVYVTIPTIPIPVRGVVCHIGQLKGEVGTKFGIELQERRGEGTSDGTFQDVDYFECEPNCAVFVSMDKLTQKPTVDAAKGAPVKKQPPQPEDNKPIRLGDEVKVFDKCGQPIKGTVRSVKKNVLGIEAQKRLAHADIPGQVDDTKKRTDFTITQPHHTKLFLPAELVIRNHPNGSSKEPSAAMESKPSQRRKNSEKQENNADQIETLTEIIKAGLDPGKVAVAHQQMALKQYEAEHKQKLAKPKKKNQEMIEHQKRVQEAKDELKMEDWSSLDDSLLDIEKQKKLLEEATHEMKIEKEKKVHEAVAQQIKLQDEEWRRLQEAAQQNTLLEGAIQRQKEEAARQKKVREEAARQEAARQKREQEEAARQEAARQKRVQEEAARQEAARQKRVQEEAARQEAARQKRVQEEAARQEAARQKRVQEEAAQQEAARQKRKQEEATQQQADRYRRVQEEAARQKRAQEEAAQQNRLQQNNKTCKTYGANKSKHDDDDSQSDEFFDAFDKVQQSNPPVDGDITSSDTYNPAHFGNESHGKAVTVQPRDNKPVRSPDPQPSDENPHNLEVGSLIQFGNPPCYGVIKWIGSIPEVHCVMAGVEVDAPIDGHTKYDDGWYGGKRLFESQINRGLFLPLKGLHPDRRFTSDEPVELPNPIQEEEYDPKDTYVKPPSTLKHTGKRKGIQGHQNSCYLDATLYGMFAFSDAFDGLFLEDIKFSADSNKAREIQEIIREQIVYRLRLNGVVTYNHIMELREKLDKMLKIKGLIAEEKDPEEFLNLLFKHVLAVDSFFTLRRPSGTDSEFFVQLFVEADKGMIMPTTQDLLHKMFKEQKITFAEYPSRLLIQVPRYGKKFKSFNGIIPSLELDISEICDGANTSHPCYVCGKAGKWSCLQCDGNKFCNECKQLWHKHPGRDNHHPVVNQENADVEIGKLQLLSVLCIETSHYVCFTRIMGFDKTDWVFFDSMAERPDDQHNLPCVRRCTNDIMRSVYNNKKIATEPLKALPNLSRRFVEDTYLCIYFDPDGVMYQ